MYLYKYKSKINVNSILYRWTFLYIMNAGEIIAQVEGLTHDRLTYFVRAGYINPEKIRRGSLNYNEYSQRDLEIIQKAWRYITTYDMRTRSAFERAIKEYEDPQLNLLSI